MTHETAAARALQHAVSGGGAHASAAHVFAGVNWKTAGTIPPGAPHSLYQLAAHMSFWQDWVLQWLDGERPATPAHACGSWPAHAAPATAKQWKSTVARYECGVAELERRSVDADRSPRQGTKSAFEMIQTIASHNSYHAGQAAYLRQWLRKWPPPHGGLTW